MSGLIFIIIIVVAIVKISNASSTTQKNVNRPVQGGPIQNEHFQPVGDSFENQKQELRQRAEKRLAAKKAAENRSILQRAKASVAEDFVETAPPAEKVLHGQNNVQQRQKELARRVEEKLNGVAYAGTEDNSDFLKQVEDLMIKGPDASITFERDFLAEGMDMLNRIQA